MRRQKPHLVLVAHPFQKRVSQQDCSAQLAARELKSMRQVTTTGLLSLALFVNGCGFHAEPLAAGGLAGGAVGAGTGAIIGAVIANGDVAASALLGGAIGIPVGLAIGAIYDLSSERTLKEKKMEVIEANNIEIAARQRELDLMREQLRTEETGLRLTDETRAYIYNGHTYGNRNR